MIRIGPAGWAYKDWSGIVYPARRRRGFHEAAFLSRFFDTIEINVSFYRPVPAQTAETWLRQIEGNPRFRFTAKLWRGFTHDLTATAEDERLVKEGLSQLLQANRLGAVLLQFPWSFRNIAENRGHVLRLQQQFQEYPLVLEVRHSSWSDPDIVDLLDQVGVGICNIDQPLFKRSVAPAALATSAVGYVRLHGRNYGAWFTENKYAGERYDYLYSRGELEPWIDRIRTVSEHVQDTYVITNNHYLGKAVVNAAEITSVLRGGPVSVPETLLEHYPDLRDIAVSEVLPKQASLDMQA